MAGLYANVQFTFGAYTGSQVIGAAVTRMCVPNPSDADLSSRVTFIACNHCIDELTVTTLDPRITTVKPGDTGALSITGRATDGGADLNFSGQATCTHSEGNMLHADVNAPASAVFAVISTDGQTADMVIA